MSLNTFLIALLAGLKIVATFVGGEPVCYSREQIDDLNFKVTRVPCDENKPSLYKTFDSHEDVAIVDLVDARCSYEELPKVLNGFFKIRDCTGRRIRDICKVTCNDGYTVTSMKQTTCQDRGNGHAAWSLDNFSCHNFTCSFDELQKVSHGYINMSDCSGNAGNDVCNVTCKKDYYPADRKQTVCKYTGDQNGRWLFVNLSCLPISCPFNKLPNFTNGQFNTTNCTGNLVHDTCDMTCDVNYYTTTIRKTVCQNDGSNEGKWKTDNFTCDAISCPFNKLPNVMNGQFNTKNCTGNLVHDTCDMTCHVNYYTTTIRKTLCQNNGSNEGRWTTDNFTCDAITCPFSYLPNVTHGHFYNSDCSGKSVGDTCNMTCETNYYTSTPKQTTCQNVGNRQHQGNWTIGNYTCQAISCPFSNLTSVVNGHFDQSDCSGNGVGDTCYMWCHFNYYSPATRQTTCQSTGRWTTEVNGYFECNYVGGRHGWIQWRGHYYKSCTTVMDWNAANSHCRSMSAHLVYINDADENSFVQNMSVTGGLDYASIGLLPINSMQTDYGFKWQDNSNATYINWESGQLADFEGCVGIKSDGQWHDYSCTEQYHCVCEY